MAALRGLEAFSALGIMGAAFAVIGYGRKGIRTLLDDDYDERTATTVRQLQEQSGDWERFLAKYYLPPQPTNHAPFERSKLWSEKFEDIYRSPAVGLDDYLAQKGKK
jgi:hypothetical protein